MVRREEDARSSAADERASPSCASPAGERPVPVGAEAPGSRPQAPGEIPVSRAGHRKPADENVSLGRKRVRGPQHEVKPGASTDKQSESRAAHFTAKATTGAPDSERASVLGGVWGAARVQGGVRNTRGPSGQPQSRQGASYKPRAKASAAQRESEGIVVVAMVAQNNATGAKGPCGEGVDEAGKREGMAATRGPNHPDRRNPVDKVRRLQRRLWIAAKRSPGRRNVSTRVRQAIREFYVAIEARSGGRRSSPRLFESALTVAASRPPRTKAIAVIENVAFITGFLRRCATLYWRHEQS